MDIGKLLLLGGAGYFLYNWYSGQAAAAPAASIPAASGTATIPSTTTQPSASTNPSTSGGAGMTTTTPPPASAPPVVFTQPVISIPAAITPAMIQKAAVSTDPADWAAVSGLQMDSDQWNFYFGQSGAAIPNVDLFPAGNRGQMIDAAGYHAERHAHGLEGLVGVQWRTAY